MQATPPMFPSQRYVILPKLCKVPWSQVLEVIEYIEYERLDEKWGGTPSIHLCLDETCFGVTYVLASASSSVLSK